MHEFLYQTDGLVQMEFASGLMPGFAVPGLDLGRDWAILGPGLNFTLREKVRLFANYDLQVNNREVFNIGSGGGRLRGKYAVESFPLYLNLFSSHVPPWQSRA